MANTQLFTSQRGALVPAADVRNEAGGLAYSRQPQAALALYACTGCLNGTYYATAETQLDQVLALCAAVPAAFVAKTAIYARRTAHMKDLPALLLAHLAVREGGAYLAPTFNAVVDNGKMLRNFVQILRSGVVGRKSLGTRPKRLVQQWLERASVDSILSAAVGSNPSLADVIKMVHPKPQDAQREALYAWLIGKAYKEADLPEKVQQFEAFKRGAKGVEAPDLPFQYLTALPLKTRDWSQIAQRSAWQATRMNLNTFARHGVFADQAMVRMIAQRLTDEAQIAKARVFPYQLLTAYQAAQDLPGAITEALQDAMEIATRNVPAIAGHVAVAVDVSGSMHIPVTGYRKGATTATRCIDVAALIGACFKRANSNATILPFDFIVRDLRLNPRDSVMTQAEKLAKLGGGGTTVSAPLEWLNERREAVDLLVLVSDNMSWTETRNANTSATQGTATMREWSKIKQRNPAAKMVCIDLQPYASSQTVASADILHVGGFSDAVFPLIRDFAQSDTRRGGWANEWIARIEQVELVMPMH